MHPRHLDALMDPIAPCAEVWSKFIRRSFFPGASRDSMYRYQLKYARTLAWFPAPREKQLLRFLPFFVKNAGWNAGPESGPFYEPVPFCGIKKAARKTGRLSGPCLEEKTAGKVTEMLTLKEIRGALAETACVVNGSSRLSLPRPTHQRHFQRLIHKRAHAETRQTKAVQNLHKKNTLDQLFSGSPKTSKKGGPHPHSSQGPVSRSVMGSQCSDALLQHAALMHNASTPSRCINGPYCTLR